MTNGLLKTFLQEGQDMSILRPFVSICLAIFFATFLSTFSSGFGACLSLLSFFRKPEAKATALKAMETN